MNFNKVSKSAKERIFSELKNNGYTKIKNFVPRKIIKKYLNLTRNIWQKSNGTSKYSPKIWNTANVIYNLQNKDLSYIKLLQCSLFDEILKKKLNDPHFRNLKKKHSNYVLNNYQARSSGKGKLFLHIDSGIPTGYTTHLQISIPLEDTNKEKGCTVVVPKSHKSRKFSDRSIKKFKYLEGKPGDVFIWDGNLWHGSLANKTNSSRWNLIATFSNWRFKSVFDIPRSMSQNNYKKLSIKEKILLGYLTIPSHDENERVSSSIKTSKLKKNVKDYFKFK